MDTLKVKACLNRLSNIRKFPTPSEQSLVHVAESLVENFDRCISMLVVPFHFAVNGIVMQRLWAESAGSRERFIESQAVPLPSEEKSRVDGLAERLVEIAESGSCGPNFPRGLEALLTHVAISAHTAFEVLAADLWVELLNRRPRLAFIALNAEPLKSDDETVRARKAKSKISFPAWLLKDPSFEISRHMGVALAEMNQWNFAKRNECKDAYLKVLGEKESSIQAIFDDKQLRGLGAFRNAAVHNGGRADKEFLSLTKHNGHFDRLRIGDSIPVDGEIIAELSCAGFIQAKKLLALVDLWMEKNSS